MKILILDTSSENDGTSDHSEFLPSDISTSDDSEGKISEIRSKEFERTSNDSQVKAKKPRNHNDEAELNFCFYCETNVLNFARHVKRNHFGEIEVTKIFSLPSGNKERKQLLSKLRKKGNFIKNAGKCIKPIKKCGNSSENIPCQYCLGFYRPKQLWRHVKICSLKPENVNKTFSHQTDAQSALVRHLPIDSKLREQVFPRMMADKISLEAKKDLLICRFGARYLKSHREKHLINVCSRKMRELAKLLLEVKKSKPTIKNLYEALHPVNFDLFVECTKVLARYDPVKEVFESPTFAMNIQTSLKQCCDIAILETLRRKSEYCSINTAEMESNFKTFKQLLEDAWRFEISTRAAADLSIKKWNKVTLVPLATDLRTFRNYLISKATDAVNKLKNNTNDQESYKLLMETVFCRLLLLNRKRIGELQRMPYTVFNLSANHSYEEFSEAITGAEKILLKKFKRVVIRGKRGRGVPVLFSPDVQKHTELLLDLRPHFVENNIFLFPKLGTENPITGYKILEKHVRASGVNNPSALTSTRLRKHLATLSQVFQMSSNDIEQLATFMGHTSDVHKQVYRLPDDVYQTAKITKLLLLMENGKAAEYKGKTLDEINVDDEIEEEFETETTNNDIQNFDSDLVREDTDDKNKKRTQVDMNNEKQALPTKKRRVLVPWTAEQKRLAQQYFKENIKRGKAPKRSEIDGLYNKYPDVFKNKSWEQIKVFIQNIYRKM